MGEHRVKEELDFAIVEKKFIKFGVTIFPLEFKVRPFLSITNSNYYNFLLFVMVGIIIDKHLGSRG